MDETFEGGATVTAKLKVWYVKVHRSASGMPLCRGRSAAHSRGARLWAGGMRRRPGREWRRRCWRCLLPRWPPPLLSVAESGMWTLQGRGTVRCFGGKCILYVCNLGDHCARVLRCDGIARRSRSSSKALLKGHPAAISLQCLMTSSRLADHPRLPRCVNGFSALLTNEPPKTTPGTSY